MKHQLISDHASTMLSASLGSTSMITDSSGNVISETKYKACPLRLRCGMLREGEIRYSSGNNPSEYTYTGQYSYADDFGLMYYGARWYDPYLNHFTQPDSIVPDPTNPQDWNRYAYARNNPLRYTDPTGHYPVCQPGARCLTPIGDKRDLTQWLVVAAVDIAESTGIQSVKTAYSEGNYGDAMNEFVGLVGDDEIYDVKKVEHISKMVSDKNNNASQMNESEVILKKTIITNKDTAIVLQPSKQTLYLPSPSIAA
jgi:RHS repeat-associated protein